MYKNELAFKDHLDGMTVAELLLKEGYIVLLSYEEDLLIINWEWCESGYPNRNEMVFMPKWEYEEELEDIYSEKD